jgi:acylphosphatase
MKKCLKLTITGLVQGVGLRKYIQKQAELIGKLEGTAQNMPDGTVVVLICGEAEQVDLLVDQIYNGSPKAKIELITTEALVNTKDFRGVFRIIG